LVAAADARGEVLMSFFLPARFLGSAIVPPFGGWAWGVFGILLIPRANFLIARRKLKFSNFRAF